MALIKIENLKKTYRTTDIETTALNDVNLTIERGEFVAIMGPSGCGKSTLLNVLGLLDRPDSGSYLFDDEEMTRLGERAKSKVRKNNIGFVFQSFNLIDELNVYDNIELPLIYVKMTAAERKQRVTEMMERMGIANRSKHFPQQLSGGQQQRVAVARALVTHPLMILADEPTGNLDSAHGKEVMDLLTELNQAGTTIIMVTHSPTDAGYASRVVQLLDGEVVSEKATVSAATL